MQITWTQVLPMWWSFVWRAILYGLLFGLAFGAIGGLIASLSGAPGLANAYGQVGGVVASFPASLLAIKQAIGKHGRTISAIDRAQLT